MAAVLAWTEIKNVEYSGVKVFEAGPFTSVNTYTAMLPCLGYSDISLQAFGVFGASGTLTVLGSSKSVKEAPTQPTGIVAGADFTILHDPSMANLTLATGANAYKQVLEKVASLWVLATTAEAVVTALYVRAILYRR
jgi:hypothetical protein